MKQDAAHTVQFGLSAVNVILTFRFEWTETRQSLHEVSKVDRLNVAPS